MSQDNETTRKMQIYIDADACPVKAEAIRVAARHGLTIFMVSNSWLRIEENSLVQRVVVAEGADVADDWIAERVCAFDIVVTADILLAARCLDAGAQCISPTGKPFTNANIGTAVAMRDFHRHLRETGESRGLNAAFAPRDRSRFLDAMELAVQRGKQGSC
jgi:uncharacterized protein YaiI (UPF0178 family)